MNARVRRCPMATRARGMAPAHSRRSTVGRVSVATSFAKIRQLCGLSSPLIGCRSLIMTGTPSSRRSLAPGLAYRSSAPVRQLQRAIMVEDGGGVDACSNLPMSDDQRLDKFDRRECACPETLERLVSRQIAQFRCGHTLPRGGLTALWSRLERKNKRRLQLRRGSSRWWKQQIAVCLEEDGWNAQASLGCRSFTSIREPRFSVLPCRPELSSPLRAAIP